MGESGRVLLADDEEMFLLATADLLRRSGYTCETVSSAEAAQRLLSEHDYDLVVADIQMPGNANLELIREIAEMPRPVPVVLVTGYPSLHTAVEALELPVIGYLLKPLELDDLYYQVQRGVVRGRLQRVLRRAQERNRRELDSLGGAELQLRNHDDAVRRDSLDAYLTSTFRGVLGALADLNSVLDVALTSRREQSICGARHCTRYERMRELVNEVLRLLQRLPSPEAEEEIAVLTNKIRSYLAVDGADHAAH
ncbi:MAG: response regulator [Candidatus Eisenbacteria bacterium]|nr:response regulator [Candidatus Eisenbacteria bacterium]MCC7140502.1 response regulator [Candidatus Eisenbacteria bacterium]